MLARSQKCKTKEVQNLDEASFSIELTIDANRSFSDILLEAIDEAFVSLGESVKTSIYFHLENSVGIKKQEIPFRTEDFQNALENIFGIGTRHLEILFVKNMHEKFKTSYKWDMPRWTVPDLTFQEYLSLAKMNFENLSTRNSK
jgi:hypothetical protein